MHPLYLGILIAVLDQWSKMLVLKHIHLSDQIPIIPGFFNLTYVKNTGAAFGMFSDFNIWLSSLSIVMLGLMIKFRHSLFDSSRLHRWAFGLLIGGILGNLIDRVRLRFVVDFFDFYLGERHFASFNVADSAICVGVGLYLVSSYMRPTPPEVSSPDASVESSDAG